jgi:hypothetical protein
MTEVRKGDIRVLFGIRKEEDSCDLVPTQVSLGLLRPEDQSPCFDLLGN